MAINDIQFHQPLGFFISIVLFIFAFWILIKARKREGKHPFNYLIGGKFDNSPFLSSAERFWFSLLVSAGLVSGSFSLMDKIDWEHIKINIFLFLGLFFLVFLTNPSKKPDQN